MRRTAAWICATLLLGLAASPPARAATVTVAPPTAALAPLGTQQFTATVNGTASTAVTWMVNGIPGGAPLLGTISTTGLYTAPADVPAALQVAIEAEDQAAPLANGSASAGVSASPATGSTFFVATTGNDTGPGSEAAPWLTIQHAVEKVPAGSTVLVQSGTYNELVTITRSGSATAGFITIAAAPGATPIVDGTGLKIPNGENGLFTLENVSFVRVIGFEVQNYTSSSAALDPVGIYVIGAGSNIEIRNNHIHDIVTTVPNSNGDALGIAIYGTSAKQSLSGIVIDGNQLDDLTLGFSESMALSGNVDGFQVTNNLIHDNNNIGIDIAGYEPVETKNLALDRARNGYVAGNTVFNISSATNPAYQGQLSSDGIYVDGGENIVIERNLVHDTDLGIEVASEHQVDHKPVFAQKVIVRDNVVYSSNIVGISIGGFGPGVGGTESTVIANNTMVGDGSYTGKGANQYRSRRVPDPVPRQRQRLRQQHRLGAAEEAAGVLDRHDADRSGEARPQSVRQFTGGDSDLVDLARQEHHRVQQLDCEVRQRCAQPVRRSRLHRCGDQRLQPGGRLARDRRRREAAAVANGAARFRRQPAHHEWKNRSRRVPELRPVTTTRAPADAPPLPRCACPRPRTPHGTARSSPGRTGSSP